MKKILLLLLIFSMICGAAACARDDGAQDNAAPAIHTAAQADYLRGDYELFTQYATGKEELSRPLPILLEAAAGAAEIEIAEQGGEAFRVSVENGRAQVYNLKVGTSYTYRSLSAAGEPIGEAKSFTTDAAAPRNLMIDGVTNARDLGGWPTASGTAVRQGMIYRTAKYNEDESPAALITAEGLRAIGALGVRTEIDLRRTDNNESGGITESPLGAGVRYISFPMRSGGNILKLNQAGFADLFAIFADEANYPIAFHCSIGTDRTGAVAFLLLALLGVGEEDLCRDYLFSNFGQIGGMRTSSQINDYLQTVGTFAGESLAEKTYAYLLSVGVRAADIDAYLAIMRG